MKRSFLLLFAALLAVTAPLAPAHAQDDSVSIDFFYDALSPYGDWIYTPNYGYVWQPLAAQQPGWSPYADGSWAFTEAGWTWISNEDFGWITYHYGRWILMQQFWVWVPGYEWAPAWVSWRQTQGQIGWAPLPPEAAWAPGIGFGGWTDSYYDVGPSYYNFVPIGLFASITSLRPFILDRSRNFNCYDQSVNITHTTYQQNGWNHIFVGGPDPQRIDGFGNNRVRRLSLHRDDDGFRRDWLDNNRDRRGNGPPRGGRNGPPGATAPQQPDPRPVQEEVRQPGTPKNPMPDGPPGVPGKGPENPGAPGAVPPRREPQAPGQRPGRGPRENGVPTPGGAPEMRPGLPQDPQGGVPQQPGQRPGRGPRENGVPTPGGAPEMRPGLPQGPQGGVPQAPPPRIVPQQRIPNAPAQQPEIPRRRQPEPSAQQPPAERPRMQPQPRVPSPAAPQIIPRPMPQRPQQPPAAQQRPPQASRPPQIAPPANFVPQNPGGRRQR